MSVVTEKKPFSFNPFSKAFIQNPYPVYQQLRQTDPIHRSNNMVILTRYEDVRFALSDSRFSSTGIPDLLNEFKRKTGRHDQPLLTQLGKKAIVFTDKPEHTRLRRLVGKCFTPAKIHDYQATMSHSAHTLVSEFKNKADKDFITHIAAPFPLMVLIEIMAIAPSAQHDIDHWSSNLRYLLEPGFLTPSRLNKIYVLLQQCFLFFGDIVKQRKSQLGADLISEMLRSKTDDGDSLSDEEVAFSCIMIFVAGRETSKCLLGNGMAIFAAHAAEYDKCRHSKHYLNKCIDEILRFDSPLQQTKRICREDLFIQNEKIHAGEQLLLCLGAANRDPNYFNKPNQFDPERAMSTHVAMGHGMHNCLGMQLSKMFARTLFGAILSQWQTVRNLDDDPPRINTSFILRGFKSLNIEIGL